MPSLSPWHQRTDLDVTGHDPTTCGACAQGAGPAWDRGVADATADAARALPTHPQGALTP